MIEKIWLHMGFEPWNLKPLCASQTSYQHNYKAMTAECRHCPEIPEISQLS